MNKYLIKLADHLDKKGLHKEADYVDWLMKRALDPSSRNTPQEIRGKSKRTARIPNTVKVIFNREDEAIATSKEKEMLLYTENPIVRAIQNLWSEFQVKERDYYIREKEIQEKLHNQRHPYSKDFKGFDEDEEKRIKDTSYSRSSKGLRGVTGPSRWLDTPYSTYGKIKITVERPKGMFKKHFSKLSEITITVGHYGAQMGTVENREVYIPGGDADIEETITVSGITDSDFINFYNYIKSLGNDRFFSSEFEYS